MHPSLNLSSEKYYTDKLYAETVVFRRRQASETIGAALTFVTFFSVSAICAWMVYQSSNVIPGCIDAMRTNGILSF